MAVIEREYIKDIPALVVVKKGIYQDLAWKKRPIVPYSLSYQFYEKIKSSYSQNPERLYFITMIVQVIKRAGKAY